MQKEDPRIKIIYNNKTMGTLYSRNIGVLEAKGKYITCIDNDDLFIDKYLFDILYEETNDEYFDILSFSAFESGLKLNKFAIKPFTYKPLSNCDNINIIFKNIKKKVLLFISQN